MTRQHYYLSELKGEYNRMIPKEKVKTFDDITIVTMLFNLGMKSLSRVKNDNRLNYYEYYVKSLMKMPQLYDNIICFCDKECADYLRTKRFSEKMYLIEMRIEELPLYSRIHLYETTYAKMQKHVDFLRKMNWPRKRHGSCTVRFPEQASPKEMALYALINHSKISFLKWAEENNPFHTKYFYWLDAGCLQEKYSLFWDGFSGEIKHVPQGVRISIHAPSFSAKRMKIRWSMYNIAYCWIPDQMGACFFGGDKENISKFSDEFENMITYFLNHGFISSEQAIITYMVKRHPEYFDIVVSSKPYSHLIENVANGETFQL